MKKIIHANNIDYLRTLKDNSVDSVVTDPPYGINFMNKKWDYDVPSVELWQEVFRVLKPGGHMLVACGTRTQHRMAVNIEDAGFEIRDIVAWVYGSGFPKSLDISKAIDKSMGAEREVVGSYKVGGNAAQSTKEKGGTYASNTNSIGIKPIDINITAPSTEEAKQWQGWGTALKPSMELWTLARKPLKGTVAQNILEYGVGGINIDGCRVGDEEFEITNDSYDNGNNVAFGNVKRTPKKYNGRFPANFIHDGSEEVEALFPQEEVKVGKPYNYFGKEYNNKDTSMFNGDKPKAPSNYNDNGSASRFFYVAKASQEERNFGLYDFEEKRHADRNKDDGVGGDNPRNRSNNPKKNFHPTVKPIELMRYLVRMITPPNGICLDPYLGSGTTAIACEMEKFDYIGIELDPQYIEIAKARVDAVKDYETSLDTKTAIKESIKEDKEKELGIQNIFDFIGE